MFTLLFYDLYMIAAGAKFMIFLIELLTVIVLVLALIGLITVIKFFVKRRATKKETDGQYWMRTGRTRK